MSFMRITIVKSILRRDNWGKSKDNLRINFHICRDSRVQAAVQSVEAMWVLMTLWVSGTLCSIMAALCAWCARGTWRASRSPSTPTTGSTAQRTTTGDLTNGDSDRNGIILNLRRFCSVCAVCKKPIVPKKGETRVQKLRALGKEFHLNCFKCEVKFSGPYKKVLSVSYLVQLEGQNLIYLLVSQSQHSTWEHNNT